MSAPGIDLDAPRRESAYPDGIPVTLAGKTYHLPAELPVDVFDPFLTDDFDLVGIVSEVMDGDDDESFTDALFAVLRKRPGLHRDAIAAIYEAFALLFGAEQFADFKASRPSLPDYARLTKGLLGLYGVSLGEAFASLGSSESDGATQKQTSNDTTASTPAPSGATRKRAQGS